MSLLSSTLGNAGKTRLARQYRPAPPDQLLRVRVVAEAGAEAGKRDVDHGAAAERVADDDRGGFAGAGLGDDVSRGRHAGEGLEGGVPGERAGGRGEDAEAIADDEQQLRVVVDERAGSRAE